jgi:hypothetical protein
MPEHVGPHPSDVQNLLLALRAIDPTARIATPISDEITVICDIHFADACAAALKAWLYTTTSIPSTVREGMGVGWSSTAAFFAKWPGVPCEHALVPELSTIEAPRIYDTVHVPDIPPGWIGYSVGTTGYFKHTSGAFVELRRPARVVWNFFDLAFRPCEIPKPTMEEAMAAALGFQIDRDPNGNWQYQTPGGSAGRWHKTAHTAAVAALWDTAPKEVED